MAQKKYFRKIAIDRGRRYGSVNLPKEALDSFLAKDCSYVEICWDSESEVLTLRPA
jgi:hypothetical protein